MQEAVSAMVLQWGVKVAQTVGILVAGSACAGVMAHCVC